MDRRIKYRQPIASDVEPMKLLMEQTFPIKYGEKFFKSLLDKELASKSKSAVPGKGIFTVVATCSKTEASERFKKYSKNDNKDEDDIPKPVYDGELRCCDFETENEEVVVGQLSCRLVVGSLCEDKDITEFQNQRGATLLYIMTLVTLPMFQRRGIASELVNRCVAYVITLSTFSNINIPTLEHRYARADPGCVAVYLHVISYNDSAMSFYKSRGFKYVTKMKDFYSINKKNYDSLVFKFSIRERPLSVAVANAARASAQRRRRRNTSKEETSWCVVN